MHANNKFYDNDRNDITGSKGKNRDDYGNHIDVSNMDQ